MNVAPGPLSLSILRSSPDQCAAPDQPTPTRIQESDLQNETDYSIRGDPINTNDTLVATTAFIGDPENPHGMLHEKDQIEANK